MKRLRWLFNGIRWFLIGVMHVLTGRYFISDKRYAGFELHGPEEGNNELYARIRSGEPFSYCRYSYTEMDIMIRSVTQSLFGIPATKSIKWLDIFASQGESNSTGAGKYTELMSRAFMEADLVGIWNNLHMGDALLEIQDVKRDLYITEAMSVEAYCFNKPWTMALEGKKVLVVSPFSEAVMHQYPNRKKIWGDKEVLPEFSLYTEDSVWYYAGKRDERFGDWFEAYDFLYDRIMEHDFDIVILGCGYFGFPLAARIKKAGRQAVHMGGATQLLFGIKGKRWDNIPHISKYYNEYWIRPDEKLKPVDDKNLDDGCYW